MKRKISLALLLILIMLITISLLSRKKLESNSENNISEKSKFISVMLQDEEGKYQENNTEFNKEGYHFNSKRSKCLNGSKLRFEDNNLVVQSTKTDKCYAYFDNNNFVEDLSGNGNHGSNVNIVSWNSEGITTSDENKTGYIDCKLSNYDFKNQVSFIMRVKVNKFNEYEDDLMSNFEIGGLGLAIINQKFYFSIFSNGYKSAINNNEINLNKWYTIVGTYDGEKSIIYVDGYANDSSQISVTGNINLSSVPIVIGANPTYQGNNLVITGGVAYITVSDALIFNRSLTKEEIANDYANEINPTNKKNLLLWYKFD